MGGVGGGGAQARHRRNRRNFAAPGQAIPSAALAPGLPSARGWRPKPQLTHATRSRSDSTPSAPGLGGVFSARWMPAAQRSPSAAQALGLGTAAARLPWMPRIHILPQPRHSPRGLRSRGKAKNATRCAATSCVRQRRYASGAVVGSRNATSISRMLARRCARSDAWRGWGQGRACERQGRPAAGHAPVPEQ